jgi:hypothetical protein
MKETLVRKIRKRLSFSARRAYRHSLTSHASHRIASFKSGIRTRTTRKATQFSDPRASPSQLRNLTFTISQNSYADCLSFGLSRANEIIARFYVPHFIRLIPGHRQAFTFRNFIIYFPVAPLDLDIGICLPALTQNLVRFRVQVLRHFKALPATFYHLLTVNIRINSSFE